MNSVVKAVVRGDEVKTLKLTKFQASNYVLISLQILKVILLTFMPLPPHYIRDVFACICLSACVSHLPVSAFQ